MKCSLKSAQINVFKLLMIIVFLLNVTIIFSQQLGGIIGRYTDSDGSNLTFESIVLMDSNRRMVTSTSSGSNGTFTFSGIQPGTYYLRFSKSGAPDVWHGGSNGTAITIGNSNVTVNFQYPQGLNITGRYTDSDSSNLTFESIVLMDSNRRMVTSTSSGSNGTFTFSGLQPGTYYLRFSKSGAPDVWYGGGSGTAITIGNSNITANFQYPR